MPLVVASRLPFTGERSVPAARRSLPNAQPVVQWETFEGPLDLLLHLIRQGQMDIFDLPITTLCEQYLGYLRALESLDLQVAGEFFVMAATLIEIKSRLLLPPVPKEPPATATDSVNCEANHRTADVTPDDPRTELVERLLEYGRYQSIAENLRQAEAERRSLFFRPATEYSSVFAMPPRFGTLSPGELRKTLERLLASVGAGERTVTSVRRQKITLRMKMREVEAAAQKAGNNGLPLEQLLPAPPFVLLEVVLLFLALLELLKLGVLVVAQEQFCGEIRVFFLPETEREAK